MHIDDEPTPGLRPDGRPDPAYAAALGLVPAPLGRRSAAFTLDAAIWVLLATPTVIGMVLLAGEVAAAGGDPSKAVGAAAGPLIAIAVGQVLTLVFGLVQLALHGRRGVTVGKAAAGIRSVSVRDFGPAGFWRIALRALVLWGSEIVLPLIGPAIMFSSSSWDPERRSRSWLDRVGGCYAVDARHGLDPFDAKAMRHARRVVAAGPAVEAVRLPSLASDRPPGEEFRIPAERSSSGVVSPGAPGPGEWTPPPIGAPAQAPVSPAPQVGAVGGASPAPIVPAGPMGPAPSSIPQAAPRSPSGPPPGLLPPAAPAAPVAAPPVVPATHASPAAHVPPPAPVHAAPARIVLRFDDGTAVAASEFGLLGRAPEAAAGTPAQLVPVADPSKRISKVHAEFGTNAAGFWIADRGSTNGTEVRLPGEGARTLPAGVRTPLPVGAVVVVGGRSFTITSEPGR